MKKFDWKLYSWRSRLFISNRQLFSTSVLLSASKIRVWWSACPAMKKFGLTATAGALLIGGAVAGNAAISPKSVSDRPNETRIPYDKTSIAELPDVKFARSIASPIDTTGLGLRLYQYQSCPFCCKVRAFLDYYGFAYDVVEVNSVTRKETRFSQYKKVPVLIATGNHNKQLNDSSYIVSLLRSLTLDPAKPLDEIASYYPIYKITDDKGKSRFEFENKYFIMFQEQLKGDKKAIENRKEERTWRIWVDDRLVHTISPNIYRTYGESLESFRWFSKFGNWEDVFPVWKRLFVIYVGAAAMYFIGKRLQKKHALKSDVRESLYDACNEWLRGKGAQRTFMGGGKPKLADLDKVFEAMPRRTSPHSIVDYRNEGYQDDDLNESNLVDDDHISLQLHEYHYQDACYEPPEIGPSPNRLTGVQQLDVLSALNFTDYQQSVSPPEYEQFDIRAPVWGPNKRQSVLLSFCGSISIITGVLCCVCGLLDFLLESYAIDASFQVESKFGMMVIVFGGLAACKTACRIRVTSLACLLGFSILGIAAGLCDAIMQWLNQYYVKDSTERAIDTAILILSLIGAGTSMIQVWVTVSIASSAIERGRITGDTAGSMKIVKRKRIALVLGMAQTIFGILITCLTVGIYAVLEENAPVPIWSNNSNASSPYRRWSHQVKWTLSSEMTNHGFLIAAAGASVALSSVQWTRWTQLVSLSLQGVALITTACNHVHPLANIYSSSTFSDHDVKLSIVLLLCYIIVLVLASYSFINSINRMTDSSGRDTVQTQTGLNAAIKELAEKRGWKLYRHTALIQLCLASLYFIVWVAGFGERFLYLLDFTPLPILILLHSVLSYSLTLTYSALMLMVNLAWVFFCGLYSIRDLYLFDYHAASKDPQDRPWWPKYNNESFAAAMPIVSKIGVHLLLTAGALMETVLAGVLMLMYLRTLGETMGIVIPNKLQHKHILRALSAIGGLQVASAALIVNFGFILFLSHLFTVEYLGDVCTFLGLLLLGTGICTFLTSRSTAVFMPLAAIMNVLSFVVLWQHTDSNGLLFSMIILYYRDHEGTEQHRAYTFSAITFGLCLFCQLMSGLSLIGLEDVLIDCKFDSSVRVEMMVQNAAALEDIGLVANA